MVRGAFGECLVAPDKVLYTLTERIYPENNDGEWLLEGQCSNQLRTTGNGIHRQARV